MQTKNESNGDICEEKKDNHRFNIDLCLTRISVIFDLSNIPNVLICFITSPQKETSCERVENESDLASLSGENSCKVIVQVSDGEQSCNHQGDANQKVEGDGEPLECDLKT